jgi:hypothetical protein
MHMPSKAFGPRLYRRAHPRDNCVSGLWARVFGFSGSVFAHIVATSEELAFRQKKVLQAESA